MSEVPLISTEKQAELLQRSDISKISLRNGEKRGCRLILIFKAPTPKQAYPADFLDFSAKNVLRDMLVFLSSPYFRAQNPLLLYL